MLQSAHRLHRARRFRHFDDRCPLGTARGVRPRGGRDRARHAQQQRRVQEEDENHLRRVPGAQARGRTAEADAAGAPVLLRFAQAPALAGAVVPVGAARILRLPGRRIAVPLPVSRAALLLRHGTDPCREAGSLRALELVRATVLFLPRQRRSLRRVLEGLLWSARGIMAAHQSVAPSMPSSWRTPKRLLIPLQPGETRTVEQLAEQYEIERMLADRLRRSSREERRVLYTAVYDELFKRV